MDLSSITYSHVYWVFLLPMIGAGADIVTGWIQASINGVWDSTKMRKGLYRKGGELLTVLVGFVAQEAVPVVADCRLATWISLYVVVMEAISCLENLSKAGVSFPRSILSKLGKLRKELDGDEEEKDDRE